MHTQWGAKGECCSDGLLRLGLCVGQTKPVGPDPAPFPSAKFFSLYSAGTRSRDP